MINVWDCKSQSLCGTLISHTQNICKLTVFPTEKKTFPFVCGSSSWDGSARCWSEELSPVSCLTLNAEEGGSCWSVAALGRDSFVTAHADKSIRIWRGDRQVQLIQSAHSDVVRDLLTVEPNCFLSVGNDGGIKVWDASSGGALQTINSAHPSFIYGIVGDGADRVATFGEEGIVKIWKWNRETKKLTKEKDLRVPMMSAWCGVFLNSETLVVGGSNGSFYIFSCGRENSSVHNAFEEEMTEFDSAAQASKTAEIEKNAQDESVLKYPGELKGKTVLIRRSATNKIEAHQWDGMEWQNLGEVLDPSEIKSPDFSFKVQLDDTGRSYDLPYNWGENPYSVAKNFLERNDLPITHLDEVANFIVKNAGTPAPSESRDTTSIPVSVPEAKNMIIEAFNSEGVLNKMKSFGFTEDQINIDEIKILLKSWPIEKLYPCLDWLRVQVLKAGDTSIITMVPFDEILEKGTKIDSSKELQAAVTMSLRLLCNSVAIKNGKLIDPGLIVKVIGKCSQSPLISTWIPLLIGLLYNCRDQLDSTKKMALLHGILTRVISFPSPDEVSRVYWLIKGVGAPVPLRAALKKETDRFPDLKNLNNLSP